MKRQVARQEVKWQKYQDTWVNEVVHVKHTNGKSSFYVVGSDRQERNVSEHMYALFVSGRA